MMEPFNRRLRHKDKKPHPVLDWVVYALVRLLSGLFAVLPVAWTMAAACAAGRALWRLYGRGRRRAMANLEAAYPDKGRAWLERIGRRSFEQLAMLGVDVLLTPRLARRDNWREYGEYKNIERAKWLMQEGKGLLLLTGHYGNFEILGYLMGLFGFNLYSVARPLDNRYLDQYIRAIRERHGQRIVDKRGAAVLMSQVREKGVSLGLIADQDAGRKGIFVDFFGRPASTFKSIALMAAHDNLPIVVGYSRRIGNAYRFEIGVNRLILPEEWADRPDPIRWITAEYTRAIEAFVREDPSQYWWVHRRWKTEPRRPVTPT